MSMLVARHDDDDDDDKNMKAMVRSLDRDTDIFKILQGISFHTQREDGVNTSSILSLQRNLLL